MTHGNGIKCVSKVYGTKAKVYERNTKDVGANYTGK